ELEQGGAQTAQPHSVHAGEIGALQAMARRVIVAQHRPSAMRDGDKRAARDRLELDVDLGLFSRTEVCIAPAEGDALGRLPDAHASRLEHIFAIFAVDLFEQPAAPLRLQAYETAAPARVAELRPAPPPAIDFAGEDLERNVGLHRDRNTDSRLVASAHVAALRTRRARSACTLNA